MGRENHPCHKLRVCLFDPLEFTGHREAPCGPRLAQRRRDEILSIWSSDADWIGHEKAQKPQKRKELGHCFSIAGVPFQPFSFLRLLCLFAANPTCICYGVSLPRSSELACASVLPCLRGEFFLWVAGTSRTGIPVPQFLRIQPLIEIESNGVYPTSSRRPESMFYITGTIHLKNSSGRFPSLS